MRQVPAYHPQKVPWKVGETGSAKQPHCLSGHNSETRVPDQTNGTNKEEKHSLCFWQHMRNLTNILRGKTEPKNQHQRTFSSPNRGRQWLHILEQRMESEDGKVGGEGKDSEKVETRTGSATWKNYHPRQKQSQMAATDNGDPHRRYEIMMNSLMATQWKPVFHKQAKNRTNISTTQKSLKLPSLFTQLYLYIFQNVVV